MKVLEMDLKRGIVKIKVQSKEDAWHLYNLIEEGDYISAFTYRRRKEEDDKIRSKKGEKERVYLKIQVTDKEFQKFTDRLRIRGKIVEGVDEIGAYHTFNIEPNMEIKIEKEWKEHHLKRLEEATKKHPKVAVLAMDDEMATLAIVHEYGVEEVANIPSYKGGKMYDDAYDDKEYYGQILAKVKNLDLPLVIVGPGFEKDKFVEFAKNELKNFVVDSTSHAGMVGVYEALKRGVIEKIAKENRIAKEEMLMEKVMEEISKNGLVAYGMEEVEKALEMGAVEKLLITSDLIKNEELLKKAEWCRAEIIIIEGEETRKKLEALGKVAALLRYKIS